MSHREKARRSRAKIIFGTVEGYVAFGIMMVVFLLPVHPGTRRQALIQMIWLVGIGIGLGIGGARFGKSGGKAAGWIAIVVLSLLVIALVVVHFLRQAGIMPELEY